MDNHPLVIVIVLTWNSVADAAACLAALRDSAYPNCRVLVVDNGSDDGTPESVATHFPEFQLVRLSRNIGYVGGNNVGLRRAVAGGADYVLLLNDDAFVTPDAIGKLVTAAESDPRLGMVGPAIVSCRDTSAVYLGGRIDWSNGDGLAIPAGEVAPALSVQRVDFVPGCALLARVDVVRHIGLLDPIYFAYYEDVDWSLRCQAVGYHCAVVPGARVFHRNTVDVHHTDAVPSLYYPRRNQILFIRKRVRERFWRTLYMCLVTRLREYRALTEAEETAKARSLVSGVWAGLLGAGGETYVPAPRLVEWSFGQLAALQSRRAVWRNRRQGGRGANGPLRARIGRAARRAFPWINAGLERRSAQPSARGRPDAASDPTRSARKSLGERLTQPLPDDLPPAPPVMVVGFVSASTGLGEVVRGAVSALRAARHPVSYRDIEPLPTLGEGDLPPNDELPGPSRANLLYVNATNVPFAYQKLGRAFFEDGLNVGYFFWEMTAFPRQWYGAFALVDEVWVASRYTQAALAAVSPVPVVCVPPLVHPVAPGAVSRADLGLPEDRCIFLFSFDVLSIPERKNPLGLIEAFRRAFGAPTEGPLLVIKMNNSDIVAGRHDWLGIRPDYVDELSNAVSTVNGVLLDRRLDPPTNSALMAACDCYVSLHRSEGFGLTIAEAMVFGKPCIATAYSGNLDFMTLTNSYPVGYRMVELARDWGPYEAGDRWADPDLDQAAALMREVFEHPEAAAERGQAASRDIRRSYSADAVARAMIRRLQILAYHRGASARPTTEP